MQSDAITFSISRRNVSLVLALTAVLVFALLVTARPFAAGAASTAGEIQIKGVGSTYAKRATTGLAVAAGGTATYSVKVVNRGTDLAQFKLDVNQAAGEPSTIKLFSGTTDVFPLASSTDGFVTAPLTPGASAVHKLTVTLPPTAVPTTQSDSANVHVTLTSTEGQILGGVDTYTSVSTTEGTTAADAFIRGGSEPFVGGSLNQEAWVAPLNPGQTGVFTLRLANNGTSPGPIGLNVVRTPQSDCDQGTFTVTDGFKNVTSQAQAGTYVTPTLNVGAHRDLKVKLTRPVGSFCDRFFVRALATAGDAQNVQTMRAWAAAS